MKNFLNRDEKEDIGVSALQDLCGEKSPLLEASMVAAAGIRITDGQLGRAQRGRHRHRLCHLDRADLATTHTNGHH
jgi:hypothetical protein